MKKTFIIMTMALFIAMLSMIGCPNEANDKPSDPQVEPPPPKTKSIRLNQTTLTLNMQSATNKTATVVATITNGAADDTLTWSSSDTTNQFVSITPASNTLTCSVTAIAETTSPITITVSLTSDSSIKATCQVTVNDLKLKLSTTATESSTMHTSAKNPATKTLPVPEENVYTVNSGYNAGNWGSSGGRFTDTTFVYIDKLITGDFKIRARVQVGAFPAGTSSTKGMMVGAFKPNAEGNLEVDSSTAAVFLQGNSEIIRALPRDGSPGATGGSSYSITRATEFIYEFERNGGFTSSVYISKDNISSQPLNTYPTYGYSNSGLNYEIQGDTPVYAGIALLCVEGVRISQLELWVDDLYGESVFYSGDSEAAEVIVDSMSLGVQGGTVNTTGTNPGSAGNPATYAVKASAVKTSGIQLVPSFVPTYSDNQNVKYSRVEGGDTTLDIDPNTGKVTVTDAGKATFKGQSSSNVNAVYYLTINATPDYIPIEDFNITGTLITGSSGTITMNQTTRLTTDISAEILAASTPTIVWTTDSPDVKFVVNGAEEDTATGNLIFIKGMSAAAAVTITATATTQNEAAAQVHTKTATTDIEVKALSGVFFEWNAGDGWDDNYTSLKGVPTKKTSNASGTVIDEDGSIKMPFNNRWLLGVGANAVKIGPGTLGDRDTNSNYAANAVFNFSKKYKLTIELTSTLTSAPFTVSLNTEAASDNGGPIIGNGPDYVTGTALPNSNTSCMIFRLASEATSTTRNEYYAIVDPSKSALHNNATAAGLTMGEIIGNQFLQFRISNVTSGQINIYKIKLEYVD